MKIVYLFGKSVSGKDTIYRRLLEIPEFCFRSVTPYTTRPMRDGEAEGEEYHFITEEQAEYFRKDHKVIEERTYHTVYGPWTYLTVDDGQFQKDGIYLMSGTLESYRNIRDYFGSGSVIPVYIFVEDGVRLERAILRERTQKVPKYEEMCRRFLADAEDFSEEKLNRAKVEARFENDDLEECLDSIVKYIRDCLGS